MKRLATRSSIIGLILLTLLSAHSFAALPDAPDFENWYQVEIILFKQSQPLSSDEIWPFEIVRYPTELVSIGPSSDELISPYSLSQAMLIESSMLPTDMADIPGQSAPANSNFLFHQQGSASRNRQLMESVNQQFSLEDESDAESMRQPPIDGAVDSDGPLSPVQEFSQLPDAEADEASLNFRYSNEILDSNLPQAFRSLHSREFTLNKIARSVRRSSRYELVMHKAWLQPIQAKPTPILIQAGEQYDDLFEIDGTLSFSRSRFLHLSADLLFTQFEPKYSQQQILSVTNQNTKYPDLAKLEKNRDTHIAIQSLPLKHARRMRSSVLHYIDHPLFGILVQINKFTYTLESSAE